MKRTYERKLIFSFLVILTVFTVGIVLFEQRRDRMYKTEALEERLDAYAGIANEYFEKHEGRKKAGDLLAILPGNIRLTVIGPDGGVTYDNLFGNVSTLGNHADRPEIAEARQSGKGSDIRTSASNSQPYLYYARHYGDHYIRVALPYDIQVRSFLKPDNGFLYFIAVMFVMGFVLIRIVGRRFGRSIRELREFSMAVRQNTTDSKAPRFPKDDLGEIGLQIVMDYNKVKQSESRLEQEREKLLQHVQSSAEGICFFNPDHTVAFYNGLFLQYLNSLSRNTVSVLDKLAGEEVFAPVMDFLKNRHNDNYFETHIARSGKEFIMRVNIFDDDSFEIILNDITNRENNRRLKQEMTGNIAHELRTPVTSIRGFLETVIDNDLGKEKERHYLERAYAQTKNLSELISDMSLLTKIEQGPGSFSKKAVRIADVTGKVKADLSEELRQKNISFDSFVPESLTVNGNDNLLYSIFRNLTDNVIRHAGSDVGIVINKYDEKEGRVYFSFADTGGGIADETQLSRLFERFYRVTEGRTRDTGGSGLGLSIVKNAVVFHGGSITAKNRPGGGLEFLFDLETGLEQGL